jgi:hypothetical protein
LISGEFCSAKLLFTLISSFFVSKPISLINRWIDEYHAPKRKKKDE